VHHRGEGVLHELAVLELGPGLCVDLLGLLQKGFVQPLELELELVLGHEVGGGAVAETVLHLPHRHRMDVLVVPGLAPHVEHDGNGLDAVDETSPRQVELGRIGRTVLREQGVGQGGAIGQRAAIKRKAQELGEARLARTVEARDPAGGKLGTPVLAELRAHGGQEVHELLVNALLGGARVPGRIAARDDVLLDLALQFRRLLLVEVDHRGDGSRDVSLEDVPNQHGITGRCGVGSHGRRAARP
jgi:hypothetical protein